MTPPEKADLVISAVKTVDRNVRHAIKLSAYFHRGAYSCKDVRDCFNNTAAAPGINVVLDSMYFELILTVARLFDNPHSDKDRNNTASIPVLMSLLSESDVLSELQQRSVDRKTLKLSADQDDDMKSFDDFQAAVTNDTNVAAQNEVCEMRTMVSEWAALKGDHLIQRIRNVRSEFLAHSAVSSSKNNKAAYGDAERLLWKIVPFVCRLQAAVRSVHAPDTYRRDAERWKEYANSFWLMVTKNAGEATDS